jgi:hypothetical protein
MKDSHLLVWFDDGQPHACPLSDVPEAVTYRGKVFSRETEYSNDVDYLRDQQNRLVGFAYVSGGKLEKPLWDSLWSQSRNVKSDGGILVILLADVPYEIESVQAMGSSVYCGPYGETMLAIPNWGFGKLGFELTTSDVPYIERLCP